jgi:catechol 2,3-dioxygenase-like lactoylglutathione lyase family enzyme
MIRETEVTRRGGMTTVVAMSDFAARPFGVGIDVADPAAMADFWQGVTAYDRVEDTPRHVYLVHPERATAGIYLHKVPEARPPGKNRLHLELWVDDLETARARVTELGGRLVADHSDGSDDDPDLSFMVFEDPESNVFCLAER